MSACRRDHFEIILRHICNMLDEVIDPWDQQPVDLQVASAVSAEMQEFDRSFQAFIACWGKLGVWPEITDVEPL